MRGKMVIGDFEAKFQRGSRAKIILEACSACLEGSTVQEWLLMHQKKGPCKQFYYITYTSLTHTSSKPKFLPKIAACICLTWWENEMRCKVYILIQFLHVTMCTWQSEVLPVTFDNPGTSTQHSKCRAIKKTFFLHLICKSTTIPTMVSFQKKANIKIRYKQFCLCYTCTDYTGSGFAICAAVHVVTSKDHLELLDFKLK